MRKFLSVPIAFALSLVFSCTALASTGSKTVDLHYNNIKVMVNGKAVITNSEPFVINGVTYLPLRDVGSALGFNVKWDPTSSTVNLTSPILIDKSEEDQYLGSTIENYLFSKYAMLNKVSFIKFVVNERKEGSKHEINVTIELDLSKNNDAWKELSDAQIETWLGLISDDLQVSFNNKDAIIRGNVSREGNSDVLLDFYKEGEDSLKVSFYDGSFRDGVPAPKKLAMETEYASKIFKISDLSFTVSAFNYYKNINSVDVTLASAKDGTSIDWSNLSNTDITNSVKEMGRTINNDYIFETNTKLDKVYIHFRDKNSKLIESHVYNVFLDKIE
ncbi:MAG: stalk domain-containing protein [Bacillota bacterium]